MAYAIRFSNDINADIKRNWSAFGNYKQDRWESYTDALENSPYLSMWSETEEVETAWENWQNEDYATYWKRDHDSREEFSRYMVNEKSKITFAEDEHGKLAMLHHDGLSCVGLVATDLEAAIAEGKELAKSAPSCELAQATVGDVKVVADLGSVEIFFGSEVGATNLYLLECDDLVDEQSIIEICDFGY